MSVLVHFEERKKQRGMHKATKGRKRFKIANQRP